MLKSTLKTAVNVASAVAVFTSVWSPLALAADSAGVADTLIERHRDVLIPAQFHVEATLLDGPVFADANGKTLYSWPQHRGRNGYSGEGPGSPACYDEVVTVTAGLMSPYPPGIELPALEGRPSCTDLWPPVLASSDAEAVGEWTVLDRKDGVKQWAYDEQPLYTSQRDSQPGDVFGGKTRRSGGDAPAYREPVGPPSMHPPGFAVKSSSVGRLLTTAKNESVYAFELDSATEAACIAACLNTWEPVIAPALAKAQGEWAILERSPGVRQWVFRGKPLYTHIFDTGSWSLLGSDKPGWDNVFTQKAPAYPSSFTVQATIAGEVLADPKGHTIYIYNCGEDSAHQLSCDHPDDTQVYRLAMCGGGDAEKCLKHWPYVEASDNEVSVNRIWRILSIDPMTGRLASADQEGAIRVWSYRGKPVYLYGPDKRPGDVKGGGIGEWRGQRNGLRAYWLRDDFMNGIL
ncbi:MAG: putative lipoprotein with Yx(FWY)xxD motif [Pseudohongiellaceae bacterium]